MPPDPPQELEPKKYLFQGGQIEGQNYTVFFERIYDYVMNTITLERQTITEKFYALNVYGKIYGIRVVTTEDQRHQFQIEADGYINSPKRGW